MRKHYALLWLLLVCFANVAAYAEKYVRVQASGTGDGSSWDNASNDLQAMINAAAVGEAVYVAAGMYKPNAYPMNCYGCDSPKDYTFLMRDIKLYGGFPPSGNPQFGDRNVKLHETILSGDLNGDDVVNTAGFPIFSNYTDNTYHVVTSVTDNDALLDGFTIASGQSMTGGGWKSVSIKTANVFPIYGAGLHANMTNLAVSNCNFVYNDSQEATGLYNSYGTVKVTNSTFKYNSGVSIRASNAQKMTLEGCLVTKSGSAVACSGTKVEISNCIFADNNGTLSFSSQPVTISNTLIYGNKGYEAVIYFSSTTARLINCTIANTGLDQYSSWNIIQGSTAEIELRNTIIRGTVPLKPTHRSLVLNFGGQILAYNSVIEEPSGSYGGRDNLGDIDPLYVNPGDPDGPDDIPGTADDGLRLQKASPCLNAGAMTDAPTADILGNPVHNLTRDIGAYESMEDKDIYTGPVACQTITVKNVMGNQWYHFNHANGTVAAINPNGLDLGTVTLDISDAPGIISYNSATLLGRIVNLRSSRYGTAILPSAYSVRFYYSDEELSQYNTAKSGSFTPADLTLAYREGGSGCSLDTYGGTRAGMVPKSATTTGEYGEDDYGFYLQASLNHFTIFAASTDEYALPVSLTSFNVMQKENSALLTWATTEEVNSSHFEIQRSQDGRVWGTIGNVTAAIDSRIVQNYTTTDTYPMPGTNLYRLKMVDKDGSFALSQVRSLFFDQENASIVYPNPVVGVLRLNNAFYNRASKIRLLSASGQSVLQQDKPRSEGVPVFHLSSGLYILQITDLDGSVTNHKVMIAR